MMPTPHVITLQTYVKQVYIKLNKLRELWVKFPYYYPGQVLSSSQLSCLWSRDLILNSSFLTLPSSLVTFCTIGRPLEIYTIDGSSNDKNCCCSSDCDSERPHSWKHSSAQLCHLWLPKHFFSAPICQQDGIKNSSGDRGLEQQTGGLQVTAWKQAKHKKSRAAFWLIH